MIQQLLIDRFAFRAHHERRDLPAYALRLGKDFGKSDKAFRQTKADCDVVKSERAKAGSTSVSEMNAFGRPECSGLWSAAVPANSGLHFIGNGVTMTDLVNMLSGYVGRVTVNQTGLSGYFDFDMPFDPGTPGATFSAGSAPSIFTAVSYFGLTLDAATLPVDVLVIDHIERPTEN